MKKLLRRVGKWVVYYARHPRQVLRPEVDVVVDTVGGFRLCCSHENYIEREILRHRVFESSSTSAAMDVVRPGDVVLDIGANIGYYSILLLKLVGAAGWVHAFEPTSYACDRLKKNLALNAELPLSRLRLNQLGLASARGRATVRIESRFSARVLAHDVDEDVSFTTIDAYCSATEVPRLDFVKIDVDGYDLDALSGGRVTLARWQPCLLCELNDDALRSQGHTVRKYLHFLSTLGYRWCRMLGTGPGVCELASLLTQSAYLERLSTNALVWADGLDERIRDRSAQSSACGGVDPILRSDGLIG